MASMRVQALAILPLLASCCGIRTGTGATDGSGTAGDDGSDGDTGDPCQGYADEEGDAADTVIRVENMGAEPVFLGGLWSCDFARMLVEPSGGTEGLHWPARKCELSCEDVLGPDDVGCDSSCPMATVIRIEPGGAFGDVWPGDMHQLADPPPHCCADEGSGCACFVRRSAAAGEYRATVNVFSEVSCAAGECDCTPNDDGWCELAGFAETFPDEGELASVTFDYPASEVTLALP